MNEKKEMAPTLVSYNSDGSNPVWEKCREAYEAYADKDKYAGFYKIHGMDDVLEFFPNGKVTVGKCAKNLGAWHDILIWCIHNIDWFLLEPEILNNLNSPAYFWDMYFGDITGTTEEENKRNNAEFKAKLKQFHSEKLAKLKASGAKEWPA